MVSAVSMEHLVQQSDPYRVELKGFGGSFGVVGSAAFAFDSDVGWWGEGAESLVNSHALDVWGEEFDGVRRVE